MLHSHTASVPCPVHISSRQSTAQRVNFKQKPVSKSQKAGISCVANVPSGSDDQPDNNAAPFPRFWRGRLPPRPAALTSVNAVQQELSFAADVEHMAGPRSDAITVEHSFSETEVRFLNERQGLAAQLAFVQREHTECVTQLGKQHTRLLQREQALRRLQAENMELFRQELDFMLPTFAQTKLIATVERKPLTQGQRVALQEGHIRKVTLDKQRRDLKRMLMYPACRDALMLDDHSVECAVENEILEHQRDEDSVSTDNIDLMSEIETLRRVTAGIKDEVEALDIIGTALQHEEEILLEKVRELRWRVGIKMRWRDHPSRA